MRVGNEEDEEAEEDEEEAKEALLLCERYIETVMTIDRDRKRGKEKNEERRKAEETGKRKATFSLNHARMHAADRSPHFHASSERD